MSNPDTTRIFNYPEVTTPASDAKILLDSQTVGSKCIDANLFRCDLIDKTITQRGTFEASEDDADGFKKVVVDIPYTDVHVASGPIATFEGEDLPLKSLTASIEPLQDLHGYDSPWAGGAGKNKFDNNFTTKTESGLTFTGNSDGSVSVSGTATAMTDATIESNLVLPVGSYILNGCPSGGGVIKYRLWVKDITLERYYNDDGNGVSFEIVEGNTYKIEIRVWTGYGNGLVFKPMIRLSTVSDSTFAPYSNICPISGWTEEVITRTGKNLCGGSALLDAISKAMPTATISDDEITFSGSTGGSGNKYFAFNKFEPNTQYTAILNGSGNLKNVRWFYTDGTYDTSTLAPAFGSPYVSNASKTVAYLGKIDNSASTTIKTSTSGIFKGAITAQDFEPYAGNTYTIPFTDGQGQSVTVYGGEIDVINGVVTPCPYYASYNGEQLTGEWISDRDVYAPNTSPTIGAQVVNIGATGTSFSTQPTSIKSLDGVNNVFASTGDVDVEYQTVWVRPTE